MRCQTAAKGRLLGKDRNPGMAGGQRMTQQQFYLLFRHITKQPAGPVSDIQIIRK